MRRYLLLLLPLLAVTSVRAEALTIRDIVELSRAGLGDDVLLALIEVDPSVFPIDPTTLKAIKAAGVSDRVIVAMVRSSRTPPPPVEVAVAPQELPQPQEPQVVVIDHHQPPTVREVQVAYPVYIPVLTHSGSRRHPDARSDYPTRPGHSPQHPQQPDRGQGSDGRHPKAAEPVYWGFGGKLRPDAWKPK